jgi:uncharacterized protein
MLNRLNGKTGIVGIITALALVGLMIFSVQAGNPQQSTGDGMTPTINVSGTGIVYGTPDIAYVMLGVDQVDPDVSAAMTSANETLRAIISAVTETGVAEADIQTANYSVFPEDRFDPQTGMPTGERTYRVNLSVNVTVREIENAGNVIRAALGAGANSLNGLSFGIADTAALEAEARTQAVADARGRAEALATDFGVTLGAPVTISEAFGSIPGPIPMGRGAFGGAAEMAIQPQINPGQLSVQVTVNVAYAIGG